MKGAGLARPSNVRTPINVHDFYHDGRGPELKRVHWAWSGVHLVAIDYLNPDSIAEDDGRHVLFAASQVVMVTPEEVIDYGSLGQYLSEYRPAAMFDLNRSEWLESFSPRHLARCRHFQLMFYDQLFDVISEGVSCVSGFYVAPDAIPRP